jgi:hypothetical protein
MVNRELDPLYRWPVRTRRAEEKVVGLIAGTPRPLEDRDRLLCVGSPLSSQAERAIGLVVESACPLCKVALRIHDERACCPCCGDSYIVSSNRLAVKRCPEHGQHCEHWEEVWARRGA